MVDTKKRYVGIANPWFTLTDGATITPDASVANGFFVIIAGNRTLAAPTNPTNGQVIDFRIKQDSTGSRLITWNSVYKFSTGLPQPTLTTTADKTDYFRFVYDNSTTSWYCTLITQGLT